MSEVLVALKGGLGNQLFEYAAGFALSRRLNLPLVLDISAYEDPRERHFSLQPFCLPEPVVRRDLHWWPRGSVIDRAYRRLAKKVGARRCGLQVFAEQSTSYDRSVEAIDRAVLLDGYFQSELYFSAVSNELRTLFATPRELSVASQDMLAKILSSDALCVHVRRGDYLSNPAANKTHGLCAMDYYMQGVERVGRRLATPHCFIFSDDPKWVRENMHLPYPSTVVDVNGESSAHEDLWLMASCRSFVIANSSLSWWGAWLAGHPEKEVVAPLQWFRDSSMDASDLVPAEWIRI